MARQRHQAIILYRASGEEIELPTRNEVCPRCDGEGKHDHPAFSDGFTSSEWAEACDGDDDFSENYFGGVYDVRCEVCEGRNVVPVADESRIDPELWAEYEEQLEQDRWHEIERAAERRMGC